LHHHHHGGQRLGGRGPQQDAGDLHAEDYEMWLDPDFDEREPLTSLLKPYPAEAMELIR
jgi:hypothetical protein